MPTVEAGLDAECKSLKERQFLTACVKMEHIGLSNQFHLPNSHIVSY